MNKQDTVWITGKKGMLASALQQELLNKKIPFIATSRQECELSSFVQVRKIYERYKPSIILHSAAFTQVDKAEHKHLNALSDNILSVKNLTLVSNAKRTKIILFSSDYVFNGKKTYAYDEKDLPNPIQFYGKTKFLAENIIKHYTRYIIIRLSWLYSTNKGFPLTLLNSMIKSYSPIEIVEDEIGSPTFLPCIISPLISLAFGHHTGIYHIASEGTVSRYLLVKELASHAQKNNIIKHIPPLDRISSHAYRKKHLYLAKRPQLSALNNNKIKKTLGLTSLGTWQEHIESFIRCYQKEMNGKMGHEHP